MSLISELYKAAYAYIITMMTRCAKLRTDAPFTPSSLRITKWSRKSAFCLKVSNSELKKHLDFIKIESV